MECLGALAILVSLGLLFGPAITSLFLLRAARRDRARLSTVEEELAFLRRRTDLLEGRGSSLSEQLPPQRAPVPGAPPSTEPPPATESELRAQLPTAEAADRTSPEPPGPPPVPELQAPPRPAEPPAPAPAPRSEPKIEWERWIGVRGAALLGGIVLALAALLFLRYSIEQGLIPPVVRVAIGFLAGIGALIGSARLRSRDFEATADALAGAGIVILYGAIWAARVRYALVPSTVAYPIMVLVTAACGLLAWRHRALVIALLGLVGGFATPLLLASGSDHPIGLFGYLLLLDLGLLVLARARRWPILAAVSLCLTAAYEVAWMSDRMGPERLILGLLILGVFALVFAFGSGRPVLGSELTWIRAGALLFPFAFGLAFASSRELGERLWPLAILFGLLSAAALLVGDGLERPWLGPAAAAGDVAIVLAWLVDRPRDGATGWEAALVALGLALVFHLAREHRPDSRGRALAGTVATVGFLVLFILSSTGAGTTSPWAWVVAEAGLALLLWRQAGLDGTAWRQPTATGLFGGGLSLLLLEHGEEPGFLATGVFLCLLVGSGVAVQGLALLRRTSTLARAAEHGAALLPALGFLAVFELSSRPGAPWSVLAGSTALAVLVLLVATRLGSGRWYLTATLLLAAAHLGWSEHHAELPWALLAQGAAVALLVFWPVALARPFVGRLGSRSAAAIAPLLWFPSLHRLWEARFGDAAIGLLPTALAALLLGALAVGRSLAEPDERRRRTVWFAGAALLLLAAAVPLQLEREWITVGWALGAVGVLALWRRIDHPGLKHLALVLLGLVTVRLLANPEVLSYHPPSHVPILNWLAYTYLVPAVALLVAAGTLRSRELERARPWERPLYALGQPAGAIAATLSAIAVGFAWINLTVIDLFAEGDRLAVSFERRPARDLTLSLAWVAYALLLLAVGLRRRSRGLRWVSLLGLLLAIVKVFLYDLGELDDLYRVASLVGLAISLLLVSLAYQRFVFGRSSEQAGPPEAP